MQVLCNSCQKTLNIPEKYAGKNIKCPSCGVAFRVQEPEPVVEQAQEPLEEVEQAPLKQSGSRAVSTSRVHAGRRVPEKKKTLMYVGIGFGALLLLGVVCRLTGVGKGPVVDLDKVEVESVSVKVPSYKVDKNERSLVAVVKIKVKGQALPISGGTGKVTIRMFASKITDLETADQSLPVGVWEINLTPDKFDFDSCELKCAGYNTPPGLVSSWGVVHAEVNGVGSNWASGFIFK